MIFCKLPHPQKTAPEMVFKVLPVAKVTDDKLPQSANALPLIVVTAAGIVTLVMPQFRNAYCPIDVKLVSNEKPDRVVKFVQPSNALSPMDVTVAGIVIWDN